MCVHDIGKQILFSSETVYIIFKQFVLKMCLMLYYLLLCICTKNINCAFDI